MPTNRRMGAAAVSRVGVSAGTIDSSSGRASVTPAPRRKVRRGMCLFVTYIVLLLPRPHRDPMLSTRLLRTCSRLGPHPHLELRAPDHTEHDRRESVVVPGGVARDRADSRHVGVFKPAAERVRHGLL